MVEIVRVEGLKELEQMMLRDLPKATARAALQRALKKAAQPVHSDWKAHAPRDEGHYQESIIIGPSSKLTRRQKREAKKEGPYFAEIHVGSSDPAGLFQEFGTITNRPQPSGRPAWDSNKAGALQTIVREIRTQIESAAARRAKKLAKG